MRGLVAAVRFLTILPMPGRYGAEPADLARSTPFFPAVGLLLGALAALVAWAVSLAAPPMLAGAILVVALLALSGGLHLDGLSDTADGLLSCRPRERCLEIMRDSHVGAMGVMAIVCVLLVKFASAASLPQTHLWPVALLMPLAGRCAILVQMATLTYVREEGMGTAFGQKRPYETLLIAVVVLLLAGWLLLGTAGLVVGAACLGVALALAAYFRYRIGGSTGDTFGAACEIVEAVPAVVVALWPISLVR